jgi:hypothetical protein
MAWLLELPGAVITNLLSLVSAQDLDSLSSGNKCLLDGVLQHTPAITLRVNGSAREDESPWGPLLRSRPPHALQAVHRKSKGALKLCLQIWGKSTQDQAVAAALERLTEHITEEGTSLVECRSVCALEIKVSCREHRVLCNQQEAQPCSLDCCRAAHMRGRGRHQNWWVEVVTG